MEIEPYPSPHVAEAEPSGVPTASFVVGLEAVFKDRPIAASSNACPPLKCITSINPFAPLSSSEVTETSNPKPISSSSPISSSAHPSSPVTSLTPKPLPSSNPTPFGPLPASTLTSFVPISHLHEEEPLH